MLQVAVDVVRPAQGADACGGKGQTASGPQPPRVERLGNLSIGLFGGEHADLFDKRGRSTTQVRRRERQWTLDLTRRAAAPADGDLDYVVADQGDILDEQPQHPLAVSRRRARIIPDTWQVGDQRGHPFLHLGSDRRGLGFACTRIRVFGFGQPLERLVPVAFQVVGDEPILGPHEQELPLRQLGVFAKHSRDALSGLIGRKGAFHDRSRLVDRRPSGRGVHAPPTTYARLASSDVAQSRLARPDARPGRSWHGPDGCTPPVRRGSRTSATPLHGHRPTPRLPGSPWKPPDYAEYRCTKSSGSTRAAEPTQHSPELRIASHRWYPGILRRRASVSASARAAAVRAHEAEPRARICRYTLYG